MHHVRQELPFGSSHEFVGIEHGDVRVSVFLFHGKPGSGEGRFSVEAKVIDLTTIVGTHGKLLVARVVAQASEIFPADFLVTSQPRSGG